MVKKPFLNIFLIIILCFSFSQFVFAQVEKVPRVNSGPRKQLATIVFSGLAGAVLGLSTLSFHGRPQDKLSNIAVGFAIGIIAGTIYTTYKQATQPYGATTLERELFFADLDKVQLPYDNSVYSLSQEWTF
ncbi:MAG: hypothetical protein H6625_13325 [Bdellovibrionaceae bacterium]|nr:hypothetical protein [Pseudobdellovibrionaceae bacterium]